MGPVRESNPGPRAPEARIIPLDQQANALVGEIIGTKHGNKLIISCYLLQISQSYLDQYGSCSFT